MRAYRLHSMQLDMSSGSTRLNVWVVTSRQTCIRLYWQPFSTPATSVSSAETVPAFVFRESFIRNVAWFAPLGWWQLIIGVTLKQRSTVCGDLILVSYLMFCLYIGLQLLRITDDWSPSSFNLQFSLILFYLSNIVQQTCLFHHLLCLDWTIGQ